MIAGEIAAAAVFNMVVAAPLAFTSTVLMTVRSLDSLRRAVRMFSELCLGGTAVGAFWVLLTTAAAARAAAADGGGGSGGVSGGGGGGGAALGSIAHLATAQLGYAFGQFACQWRQKSGGPLRVALHAARTACTCWTAIVAAEAAAPEAAAPRTHLVTACARLRPPRRRLGLSGGVGADLLARRRPEAPPALPVLDALRPRPVRRRGPPPARLAPAPRRRSPPTAPAPCALATASAPQPLRQRRRGRAAVHDGRLARR